MTSLGMAWQTSKSATVSVDQLDSSVQKEQCSPHTISELSANLIGFESRIMTNHSTAQLQGTAFSPSFNPLPHPCHFHLFSDAPNKSS